MIRVGIPSKGRISEGSLQLLRDCGYRVSDFDRRLVWRDDEHDVEFYLLRPADIPVYVTSGVLAAGITGGDFLAERGVDLEILVDLGFGGADLCVAVAEASNVEKIDDLRNARVATSLPNVARSHLPQADIVYLTGSVEVAIELGIADAIVDLVDTGTTLRESGLRVVGQPLLRSAAVLVAADAHSAPALQVMKNRLLGRTLAAQFVMVEYDVPESVLEDACAITPGWESPTVAPLREKGWFAVRAMVRAGESHRILDRLAAIGCAGVVVTRIEHVRSGGTR